MPSVNHVVVAGHLGRDAEQKFTQAGKSVVKFSIGITKKKDGPTEWVNIVAWEAVGEAAMPRLTKGTGVYVTGSLHTSSWGGENGTKKQYRTEVNADSIAFWAGSSSRQAAESDEQNIDDPIPF